VCAAFVPLTPKQVVEPVDLTILDDDFVGNRFDRMRRQVGVDADGVRWVRTKRTGVVTTPVEHSDRLGDGLRTHFTHHEHGWTQWCRA